jgi:hypothetical protein
MITYQSPAKLAGLFCIPSQASLREPHPTLSKGEGGLKRFFLVSPLGEIRGGFHVTVHNPQWYQYR